jgi:hypothetical protein
LGDFVRQKHLVTLLVPSMQQLSLKPFLIALQLGGPTKMAEWGEKADITFKRRKLVLVLLKNEL